MDFTAVQHGLLLAARSGNLRSLDSILGSYPGLDVNFVDEGGLSPLMHCVVGSAEASGQHAECCEVLLDIGASLDVADVTNGRTALHWAAAVEREDIVSLLLAAGADAIQCDFHNDSAVDVAVGQHPPRCLAVFLANLHSDLLQIADSEGLTLLIKAIQKGNIEAVTMLLNANIDVNMKTGSHGWTAIHWACHADQSDILSLLLRSGADVSATDVEQKTAGHIAAITENPDCLSVLIKQFGVAVVQVADQSGVTPLMYACGVGNDRHVKVMLKKKVDITAVDVNGQSALHWCKENQHTRCVDLLCKRHPEMLNQPDAQAQTALHHAAIVGNAVVCMALCQQPGIQINCLDNDQHTAIHWASVSGHVDVLMCLADCGANLSSPDINGAHALHYAVQLCSTAVDAGEMSEDIMTRAVECIQVLKEKGCQVDARDNEKRTPLMWAAAADGMNNVCVLLTQLGADVNAHDSLGMTALHIAVNTSHLAECVTLVSELGADVNAVDHNHHSPLFVAVSQNATDMVGFLLQSGATPDKQDKDMMSIAHIASSLGYIESLELIHSHVGHIDMKNDRGARPLHEAAGNGHADCVQFLLKAGCSVDSTDVDGSTPLHFAAAGNHADVCSLLIAARADVNGIVTTDQGVVLTPLDFAENSSAFDALQEIQSAGGVFGRQLGQQAPSSIRMDSIEEEKERESEAIDVKLEEGKDAKIEEPVKEESTVVQRDISEAEREEDVPPEIKQEVEGKEQKLEIKDEKVSDEKLTDREEAEDMDRQPDGEESEAVIKAIMEEPQKEDSVETGTHKEEEERLKGDEARETDDDKGRRDEQRDKGQKGEGMRQEDKPEKTGEEGENKEVEEQKRQEEKAGKTGEEGERKEEEEQKRQEEYKAGDVEGSEVKVQGSDRKEEESKVDAEKEDSDRHVADVVVRDEEMKMVAQAQEIKAPEVQEREVPLLEVETRQDSEHDKERDEQEDKTAIKIAGDSLPAPTAGHVSDLTDTLTDEQTQPAASEAVELPIHQAAPPPTLPSPTKKRRRWLLKSSKTDDQQQQQTESPKPKRRFSIRRLSKAEIPSTRKDSLEMPVTVACAYGALVGGAVGGIVPRQHILQQLRPVLPQLQNVADEMVDEVPVESQGIEPVASEKAEAKMETEVVISQVDNSRPTQRVTGEDKVEAPVALATTSTEVHIHAASAKAVDSEAVKELVTVQLEKDDQPPAIDENVPVPGSPPTVKQPNVPVADTKDDLVREMPTVDSGLKKAMEVQIIGLSLGEKKQPVIVEEIDTEKQPAAAEHQDDVAIQSQPIVLETRHPPGITFRPMQSVVAETDRKPVSVSQQHISESPPSHLSSPLTSPTTAMPQLAHDVGEKSIGLVHDVAAVKTDKTVPSIQDTGGQVETDTEHKLEGEQQKPDLLSDGEKKLIESLRMERERPSSAAANAIKELARAHALQLRMIRNIEHAKLDRECNEMALHATMEDEKASLRASAEQRRYEDWLKKLDSQSKAITETIDKNTAEAAIQNEQLSSVLAQCGGIKRPTVAQWLENKLQQQRSRMQEELIYLDSTKAERERIVAAEKQLADSRAERHQGWEKQRQLQDKIKNIKSKHNELISTAFVFPARPMRNPYIFDVNSTRSLNSKNSLPSIVGSSGLTAQRTAVPKQAQGGARRRKQAVTVTTQRQSGDEAHQKKQGKESVAVKITTSGFQKLQEEPEREQQNTARLQHLDFGSEELWDLGDRILSGTVSSSHSQSRRQKNTVQFVPPGLYTPLVLPRPHSASGRQRLPVRAMERSRKRPTSAG